MATQRKFESATHHHTVNGSHHRLGRVLDRLDHAQQVGVLHRLGAAEFLDVRTAREGFASAGEDNGPGCGLGAGFGQAFGDPLAGCETKAVDWWVVQRDHGDVAMQFVFSSHACFPQW